MTGLRPDSPMLPRADLGGPAAPTLWITDAPPRAKPARVAQAARPAPNAYTW
jgi:hypothetical protein